MMPERSSLTDFGVPLAVSVPVGFGDDIDLCASGFDDDDNSSSAAVTALAQPVAHGSQCHPADCRS
jgi:hypothetical protein